MEPYSSVMNAPGSLSNADVDRLGERLRTSSSVSESDLSLLQDLRSGYEIALQNAQGLILETFPGVQVSSRLKTVHTTVDKLRRESGMKLSRMQDIAGLRLVEEMTLAQQDHMTARAAQVLGESRVIDRRSAPSHGYRAVHIYSKFEGRRLEVQIRTRLQDRWAQIVERLADRWGRQIRYGGEPEDPARRDAPLSRKQICELVIRMSDPIAWCEAGGADPDPAAKVPPISADFYCREVNTVLRQLASKAARVADL